MAAGRTSSPSRSKNEELRGIVLTGDLLALSPFVFHRRGQRIMAFRDGWADACEAAKAPGLLFHDLRRSAVRNLDKSGVSQAVARKISGHKTDSIFRRYRIVDEVDIEQALEIATRREGRR